MNATQDQITSLESLYNSCGFACWQESITGNDGWINDPERRQRIEDAAEHGCDGSTHGETIQDWRDFLDSLSVIDPEWPDDGGDITQEAFDSITKEINACEQWHIENGSLDQQGS